jgi:prepilin-type N-terminal cleavage/methylation domain-containing protein
MKSMWISTIYYLDMKSSSLRGFSLVEALVTIALLGICASLFSSFKTVLIALQTVRAKLAQTSIANEKIEIINNIPYDTIGTVGGAPAGALLPSETIVRNGKTYLVRTTIRNIDDPFDGTLDGMPDDASPIDYKLAEVTVTCTTCPRTPSTTLLAHVQPPSLESITTNGALVVNVTSATGAPLVGATVTITNPFVVPPIALSDITNGSGRYTALGLPPSSQKYVVTVSKLGMLGDMTLPVGASGNPNPTKPHATVTASNSTQLSFAIDAPSTLNITTVLANCTPIASIPLTVTSTRLVGSNPTVYAYTTNTTTTSAGTRTLSTIPYDTYTATETSSGYTLVGTVPRTPLTVSPGTTANLTVVLIPQNNRNLQVTVLSTTTGLPIGGASVRLKKGSSDTTNTTSTGSTDCTPPGQTVFTGRGSGNHTLTVSKSGYTTSTTTVSMSSDEKQEIVLLAPL